MRITVITLQGTQLLVASEAAQSSPTAAVEAVAPLTSDTVFANGFENAAREGTRRGEQLHGGAATLAE